MSSPSSRSNTAIDSGVVVRSGVGANGDLQVSSTEHVTTPNTQTKKNISIPIKPDMLQTIAYMCFIELAGVCVLV